MIHLLQSRKLAAKTINSVALAAIADQYRLSGLPSPTNSVLVNAAKRVVATQARQPKAKLPLLISMIKRMAAFANPDNLLDCRDILIMLLLTTAMLRASELVNLKFTGTMATSDIWSTQCEIQGATRRVLWISIKKSKTDQEGKGHLVIVSECKDQVTCPVIWFERYSCFPLG